MRILIAAAIAAVSLASVAEAFTSKEDKCLSRRQHAAGKYASCMNKVSVKLLVRKSGMDIVQRACTAKYADAWTKRLKKLDAVPCNQPQRYEDNGDGTVTDHLTGLLWEKKNENSSIHDVGNSYTWSTGGPWLEDGTVFTLFLATLNSGDGFAGSYGWRLPTWIELASIRDLNLKKPYYCVSHPCIDVAFGPNQSSNYWSATTRQRFPSNAWRVDFHDGDVLEGLNFGSNKTSNFYVRAVRGGL